MKTALSLRPPSHPCFRWLGSAPGSHFMLAAICTLGVVGGARGEIQTGRGSLSLTATLDQRYDSNIFLNQFRDADSHTLFSPGAAFVRDAGLFRLDSRAGVNFQHFQKHDEEDSNDPFAEAGLRLTEEESRFDAEGNLFYRRRTEANVDVNTRPRVEEYGVKGLIGYFPTEKLGYRLNAEYVDQNFLVEGMSDIRTRSIGGEGRFHYSPKLDAFLGLGKRWNDTYHVPATLPSMDSEDIHFWTGVEGEIWPKVTGQVAVGWVRREFQPEVGGRQSGVTFDTSVLWRPDDETTIRFRINRDLDTTPVDQSVMRQVTGVEVRREFREKLQLNLGLFHGISSYIGVGVSRRDKTNSVQTGADYLLTKYLKAGVHLSYADTQSNLAIADYDRFIGGAKVAFVF